MGGGWQIRFGAGQDLGQPVEIIPPGDVVPDPVGNEIKIPGAEKLRDQSSQVVDHDNLVQLPLPDSND